MKRLAWAIACVPLTVALAGCGSGWTGSAGNGSTDATTSEDVSDGSRADIVLADDNSFDRLVLMSDIPVLVDFSAPWCGPCRLMEPHLQTVANRFAGRVQVVQVNIDDSRHLARRFRIQAIPAVFLFHNGQVVDRSSGLMEADELAGMLNRRLDAVAVRSPANAGVDLVDAPPPSDEATALTPAPSTNVPPTVVSTPQPGLVPTDVAPGKVETLPPAPASAPGDGVAPGTTLSTTTPPVTPAPR